MRPMKDSGVEWLGGVPEDWRVTRLDSVFVNQNVKNKSLGIDSYLSLMKNIGIIPYAEKGNVGNKAPVDFDKCKLVSTGDFVLNSMNFGIGSFGVSSYDGMVSPVYIVLKPTHLDRDADYYRHLFNTSRFRNFSQMLGSGILEHRAAIPWEKFKTVGLPVPPLQEQVAIASYLDQETSQIDQLISKKEKLIEKLLERRQALITQVVTKGLDPNVPMKDSGVEWLGDVPLHWSIRPLRSIASTISSPVDKKSIEGQSSVLLCNYTDVTYNDLIHADINFMQATATLAQIRGYKLKAGDTVITKDSETAEDMGLSAFVVAELSNVLCGYHLAIVRPRKRVVPRWLTWSLRGSSSRTQMTLFSRGLTRVSLGQGSLRSIKVATPPADEQTIIASFLDQETAQIDLLVEKARKAIELLKERRQALITQVVTGKIDIRGFAGGNS
tara:strand:+ start:469 stop:1788 length:1320 start_codon:yes stop_codon:yes gene_type:complete